MFNQTQVDGGSREQAACEDSDEFSNVAHFLSSRALGLTSWCFYGLFKVVAKVVAAISFPLSAGLPIDSHLRYRSADSSRVLALL
jgi:hypothetical protein